MQQLFYRPATQPSTTKNTVAATTISIMLNLI